MNSLIYTANPTSQTLATDDKISLGSTIRRYGCNCRQVGNSIVIDGEGYYSINATVTCRPTTAGVISVAVYKDGNIIPGATASASAAAGNYVTLPLIGEIREMCCCCDNSSVITFVWTGVAGTVSNIAVKVDKA